MIKIYQHFRTKQIEEQLVGDDEIMVDPLLCGFPPCSDSCMLEKCSLCFPCLHKDDVAEMQTAFREHIHKGAFRRLIPSVTHFKDDVMEKMTYKNKMMTKWFKRKCEKSVEWC